MNDTLTQNLLKLLFPEGLEFKEFKPHTQYIEGLDWFQYLERDCSFTSHHVPGTNVVLLLDNNDHKLVGIQIMGFLSVAPEEVVDGYKEHNRRL